MSLGCLIIMLAPIAPHFCSELWSGFVSAPNRINTKSTLIDWNNGVLKQTWPKVDEYCNLSLLCKVISVFQNLIHFILKCHTPIPIKCLAINI